MNLFLAHLSLSLGERCCFLVMDQAGWHVSEDLIISANRELVFLPPYSPELNPVERFWPWLKRHSLRNRCHESLEAIMDAVQDCLQGTTPAFLKTLPFPFSPTTTRVFLDGFMIFLDFVRPH